MKYHMSDPTEPRHKSSMVQLFSIVGSSGGNTASIGQYRHPCNKVLQHMNYGSVSA